MIALPNRRAEKSVTDYYEALTIGSLTMWRALLAENCIVHDPVGSQAASNEQELGEVWKLWTGPFEKLVVTPDDIFYAGDGAAVHWSATGTGAGSSSVDFEGISVFEMGENGKITTLMTWWDPAEVLIRLADHP